MTLLKNFVFITSTIALTACGQTDKHNTVVSELEAKADTAVKEPELSGFDCIGEFASQVTMLGRGKDYPNFIAEDITDELLKQDFESKLVSAKCTEEAKFGIKTTNLITKGESQQAIDYLEATFPLELVVYNGEENWILNAAIKYEVSGLATKATPGLMKHFIVNQSYDMEKNVLLKIPVKNN